jgi:hypothetical protein
VVQSKGRRWWGSGLEVEATDLWVAWQRWTIAQLLEEATGLEGVRGKLSPWRWPQWKKRHGGTGFHEASWRPVHGDGGTHEADQGGAPRAQRSGVPVAVGILPSRQSDIVAQG